MSLHFCKEVPISYVACVLGVMVELISALNTILSVFKSPKVIEPPDPFPALNVISPSTVKEPLMLVSLCKVMDSEPFVDAKVI